MLAAISAQMFNALLDRVPSAAPSTDRVRLLVTGMRGVVDAIDAQQAKLASNKFLTDAGRRDALRQFVEANAARKLMLAKGDVEVAESNVRNAKAAELPRVDKADHASALLRAEHRAVLRSLDAAGRNSHVASHLADPVLVAAVLESPTLAGLDGATIQDLLSRHIEAKNPALASTIAAETEAGVVAKCAVEAAEAAIAAAISAPGPTAVRAA